MALARKLAMNKRKPILKDIPIEKLTRGMYQPRREFDKEALEELAQSIRSNGIIQPIVVRPTHDDNYEIIAGERRWRASQIAGFHEVSCLVGVYTDEQAAEMTTVENVNRVDLNPVEEAQAYQRLIDEFGYIHEEVAAAVGKSRVNITNMLRLLKLAPYVQEKLISGKLTTGHGKSLAVLTIDLQHELADKCIARGWSVRKLEKEVKLIQNGAKYHSSKKDPNLRAVEQALSEHIGCKVAVDFDDGRGQLKIDFKNLDILQGVFHKMGFEYE